MSHKSFLIIKPEIRILGLDDDRFASRTKGNVLIVGLVLHGGSSLDGAMHTYIAID